jgi:murein DD-endopeptidase MepM/ murein hydrolase activator NlpD
LNPAQRNRNAALLKASGFEDAPALTVQSTDGEIPQGRELSFAWLTGTVMTGLTSVLLMGAALYVSFQGQDTFSTAYEALQIITQGTPDETDSSADKGDRVRPVAATRSELEIVEASIRESVEGRDIIRNQQFVRLRATLATAATALTENVPAYDPVAILESNEPIQAADSTDLANPAIYGATIEGEVAVSLAAMPISMVPPRAISDQVAAEFVRTTVENFVGEGSGDAPVGVALAYAPGDSLLRELGVVEADNPLSGIAQNVSIVPKTTRAEDAGLGRAERFFTIRERGPLSDVLLKNGFGQREAEMVLGSLRNVLPEQAPVGAKLHILMGPSRQSDRLIPYRLSIYFPSQTEAMVHAATVSLTDQNQYVLAVKPQDVIFPEEDTEEINVNNLPTVYNAIWETARKHDIDDATTKRIVAMYAYDVDLTKRISAGDSIEVLRTEPGSDGRQELLYVGLKLGSTLREFYRFRTDDGTVDYFDPSGETGKRFLTRQPVQGGGRLTSRFGMRKHPIFKRSRMHAGIDLAAPKGTPIYASGDGVVEKASRVSGYGLYVELQHVNNFETGYGHMSRIAEGMKPGVRVRQGQIIGYVGSTGNSTGNHLHFEIKINGRPVDPLSVKLPRDKSLAAQYDRAFELTIEQIRDLMQRDPAPMTVASIE